ncbi:MAG: OsmC family protein [Thermoflavifilum sp.]|nr:OsmC family protein [Thermoflavifilum sp.]
MAHFEVVYQGDLRCQAKHIRSGTLIETDAPVDNHGKGERFSPTDLVATALGVCMMTVMGIAAREKQIVLDNTRIEIEKIMGTAPRRIVKITVHIYFPEELVLSDADRSYFEHVALNCPVAKSIHPDIQQDIHFHWSKAF